MVALDDAAVGLCLAGLDHLTLVVGVVQLKAVLVKEGNREHWIGFNRGEGLFALLCYYAFSHKQTRTDFLYM